MGALKPWHILVTLICVMIPIALIVGGIAIARVTRGRNGGSRRP
jgi:hypothetical protein